MSNMARDMKRATRVLVADDDPIFAATAESCLRRVGCVVRHAADGYDAFEALGSEDFDLVLVDLSMPRVDGFRLIALIRATPRMRSLPVIVLSSRDDVAAIDEAYALGANAFQTKPVNWALFPSHMAAVIRASQVVRDLSDELDRLRPSARIGAMAGATPSHSIRRTAL